jgi:hypothetical protein
MSFMTTEEREMLTEMLPPGAAVIEWHWVNRDGQPDELRKTYLVAFRDDEDAPLTAEAYLTKEGEWLRYGEKISIVAWASMPAFPERGR